MRLWLGRFKVSPQVGSILVLPREALGALGLTPGEVAVLRAGHRRGQVWVQASPNAHSAARLSRDLFSTLPLPANHRFWLRRDDRGELALGPILGFLSLRSIYASQRACPYAGDQQFFRDICRLAAATGGLAYVFGPGDIDWASLTTRGYTHLATAPGTVGRWVPGVFPLPDVVYNRILGRSRELDPHIQAVENRLRQLPDTASFFNPGYFDKWEVSDILSRDPQVGQFIPVTRKASPRQLKNLLIETGLVYVKPRAGFAGHGIMRVERLAPGRYRIARLEGGARPIKSVGGWLMVRRLVGRIAGRHPSIVQQAVRLPTYRRRSFDLRAMVQKDESGHWRLTALVAKVAAPGGITTHIRTGGDAHPVGPVLREVYRENATAIRQRAEEAVLAVAEALERGLGKELGELGMDLAVDSNGRPWVLEVNAKPGRKVFALNPAWNRRWLQGLVFYGGFRAGFVWGGRFAGARIISPASTAAAAVPDAGPLPLTAGGSAAVSRGEVP